MVKVVGAIESIIHSILHLAEKYQVDFTNDELSGNILGFESKTENVL